VTMVLKMVNQGNVILPVMVLPLRLQKMASVVLPLQDHKMLPSQMEHVTKVHLSVFKLQGQIL
jgi:hypothetical protein